MNGSRATSVPQVSAQGEDATLSFAKVDYIYRAVRAAIFWIGTCAVILCAGYALHPFAGKVTVLSVFLSFLADIKFVAVVSLAGVSCAWAVAERILRRRKTEQLQARIIDLETRIDPTRTSSELTTRGTTNPRDR